MLKPFEMFRKATKVGHDTPTISITPAPYSFIAQGLFCGGPLTKVHWKATGEHIDIWGPIEQCGGQA